MKLSATGINVYKKCQRWFYYKYVARAEKSDKVENKWGAFGTVVHEAIENINNFKNFREAVNHYWIEQGEEIGDMNIMTAYDCVEYGLSLSEYSNYLENEMKIEFEFDEIPFIGYIDRVLKDHSILDWKTSTFNIKKVEEYENQTMFYAWAYYRINNVVPPKSIIVFNKAKKVFEREITLGMIKDFEKYMKSELKLIKSKKEFKYYRKYSEDGKNNNGINGNCFFCPYKILCRTDEFNKKESSTITISYDHLNFKIEMDPNFDPLIDKVLTQQFSYVMDGAHYAIKAARKRGNKMFNGIINLYNETKKVGPLGLLDKTILLLEDYKKYAKKRNKEIIIKIKDLRKFPEYKIVPYSNKLKNIELRDYQLKSVEHILNKSRSFTEICTGAGKTVIAAEIIRRKQQKTLFVVDVGILLKQTKDVFEELLETKCGTITEGKQNWKDLNIATIQTIIRMLKKGDKEFIKNLHECGVLIVDEAHASKSKSYKLLFNSTYAPHKIGLTGTAFSNGNDSLELYRTFGYPDFKITTKELIEQGYLVKPEIIFLNYEETEFILNGTYEEVYDQIIKQPERFELIEKICDKHKEENVLIIVNRIEHIEMIEKELQKYIIQKNVFIIQGKTPKKQRDDILNFIKKRTGNIIIGTSQIVQKGLNIPNLSVLINVTANKGDIFTIQSLGRILRKHKDKKAIYYDFNDKHFAITKHTKQRKKAFTENGYEIRYE